MTSQYGQNRNRKKVKDDNIQRQHYDKPIWPEQKQKKVKYYNIQRQHYDKPIWPEQKQKKSKI